MSERQAAHYRWAIYAPRLAGAGWILHGIYPTQADADAHARNLHPRVIAPVSLRGRPPERFADLAGLERWFSVQT